MAIRAIAFIFLRMGRITTPKKCWNSLARPHIEKYTARHVDKNYLGRVGMALARDEIDDPDEWLKAFEMVYNNEEVEF